MTGAVAFMACLTACTPNSQPSPSPTGAFAELVDAYLEGPEADQYGTEQVAALLAAREAGELGFEAYAAAIDQSLECISAAGFFTEKYPVDESRGFPVIDYFYESPESGNPVADACMAKYSSALESVYQIQPTSAQAETIANDARIGPMIACLEKLGVDEDLDSLNSEEIGLKIGRLMLEASEVDEDRAHALSKCAFAS